MPSEPATHPFPYFLHLNAGESIAVEVIFYFTSFFSCESIVYLYSVERATIFYSTWTDGSDIVVCCVWSTFTTVPMFLKTIYLKTVCAVFALSRSFYPMTSVHPVSVLVLHPREIQNLWSQTVRQSIIPQNNHNLSRYDGAK